MADKKSPRTPLMLSPEALFRYQIVSAVKARIPFDERTLDALFEIGRGNLRATDDLALKSLDYAAAAGHATVSVQHVVGAPQGSVARLPGRIPPTSSPTAQAGVLPAQPPDKGRRRHPASASQPRGAMIRHKDPMFPPGPRLAPTTARARAKPRARHARRPAHHPRDPRPRARRILPATRHPRSSA
jgi:hypothetical protein